MRTADTPSARPWPRVRLWRRGRGGPRHAQDGRWGLLFMAPALGLVLAFKIIPLLMAIADSMRVFDGGSGTSAFVGLDNYVRMLGDDGVRRAFFNALELLLLVPIWVLLPLVLAVLIFERTPGWRFFRAIYFLPYIIAPVVAGIMFRQILHVSGPVNSLLRDLGLGSLALPWLASSGTAIWAVGAVALWSFFGLGVVTYLAGLSTMPNEVLEAAELDGAGFWARVFRVIIPILRPVVLYWTVLSCGGILIWLFPIIQSLTEGGPGNSSTTPEYLVYLTAFRFLERGYASAIGVVLFVFVAVIYLNIARRMYTDAADGR